MKGFLAKRWHGIPVGILTAVLFVCLLTGSALAAYQFWSGSAVVTVQECMSITTWSGDGSLDTLGSGATWTVSMFPGETKTLNLRVSNASSVGIVVTVNTALAGSGDYLVPASGGVWVTLSITAGVDAVPGIYTIPLTITR